MPLPPYYAAGSPVADILFRFSDAKMRLEHAGIDYKQEIDKSCDLLQGPFRVDSPKFLLPFNPVSSCSTQPVRIAFFGFNAYCKDGDYAVAQEERNFAEWCQGSYNRKLFTVMGLWSERLGFSYKSGGSIYYTNFIKLVLREDKFKKAVDVERVLKGSPACESLFKKIVREELVRLKSQGCKVFVCFGWTVFSYMEGIAAEENIQLIREHHFSRYSCRNTERLISEYVANI